jgi:hypothetical protein
MRFAFGPRPVADLMEVAGAELALACGSGLFRVTANPLALSLCQIPAY